MGLPPALKRPHRKTVDSIIRIIIAMGIAFTVIQFNFDYLESALYDMRVHFRPAPKLSGKINIILIDSNTISKLKGIPGFSVHTNLLKKLAQAKPKAIVYTRSFAPLQGFENQDSEEDRRGFFVGTQSEKAKFASAAALFDHFWMQTDFMERAGESGKLALSYPLNSIQVGSGPKTADKNILAKDGVTRRELISYQNQNLLHPQVAALFNPEVTALKNIRGVVNLFDSEQVYIDFAPIGAYPVSKFEDVLSGKFDLSKFHDKLVLIGDDIGASAKDYVATPESHDANMTVTELQANMFDTLIRNSAPKKAPYWIDILFTLAIALLTLNVVLTMRPLRGILILLGTAFGFIVLSWLAFYFFGLWIEMAHPILTIFICYYFFIPYRLIVENRRSWEYYQKHQLLQQVEELKTNFISMMSHDLKTPIARIQGMTDIISKDKVILSHQQQEAVDTIKASSADLLSFINSILNYARIESHGVELHKQGRDVNELLKDVIKRHEFLAHVKHMKIETELEPLFSLSVDPDLMKQVFSNLLENAIKYSPENSTVKIKSQEANGSVQIQFIDEGPGIAQEELPHVFMKFFRSKNVKNSPIKGSGLGLYLAKYFIGLHKGNIHISSTAGKGSTFTVELPF